MDTHQILMIVLSCIILLGLSAIITFVMIKYVHPQHNSTGLVGNSLSIDGNASISGNAQIMGYVGQVVTVPNSGATGTKQNFTPVATGVTGQYLVSISTQSGTQGECSLWFVDVDQAVSSHIVYNDRGNQMMVQVVSQGGVNSIQTSFIQKEAYKVTLLKLN